jgi:cellulose synthase/poly-beta-1,6-N-acetylglucosamine synthase-like glycosyltransferase
MVQVLDWIIALSWTARVLVWRRMLPLVPNLGQAGYPRAGRLPSMTVIVPARNEADNIAATLRSLLGAEGVALQIVAVDDRSTDQTGAVMEV